LKQLIREYGYESINSNLFELSMENKREYEYGGLEDWYFEILSNGYYDSMMKIINFNEKIKEI
jgi:hypothetical protein